MVGETGFEPATPGTQNQRSTKLSYSPRGLLSWQLFISASQQDGAHCTDFKICVNTLN